MKRLFLLTALCCLATPAVAGVLFDSVEDRAAAVSQQVAGHHDYYAFLAIQFADIAEEEKSQHDIAVAKYFIGQAEQAAAKSGAAK
ncbi:MAG: hypothetical protein Q9M22_07395 [Mariprofundaceae bacterium]|nr:hypothetical protein [Mariprofundaceae bacterium]